MSSHPGKPITLYNIAELANVAYKLSFSKDNIKSGFTKTGVWELNRNIFSEDDFLMAAVTDRPQAANAMESVDIEAVREILDEPEAANPTENVDSIIAADILKVQEIREKTPEPEASTSKVCT